MKTNVWIMNHYASGMFFDKGGRHYNFAKHLKQSGYKPVLFCANSKHNATGCFFETDALWHEHLAEGIEAPFVFVKARPYSGNGKQRVLNMIDFYFNVKKAAKECAKRYGAPDIIYASSVHPLTLVAGIQLAKKFGVKCICEVRDFWPESIVEYSRRLKKNNPLIKLLYLGEKWIYKKADTLILTGDGGYDYILEQGWENVIPRDKVHYINNGVDLDLFHYNRDHFQIKDEDLENSDYFKVIYAGSIRRVNNLGLLLDVAKEIKPPHIKFLIWGNGDELDFLRTRVTDEKIENVVFKGRVEKKYIPYIVSQANLNLAHNEPSPLFRFGISFNKLFDYLAAEKPVLSDFPCKYNPAVQLGAGTDVTNPAPQNIAREIERYAELDAEEYAIYQKNAATAAKEYDFANLTQKLVNAIESI
jgi:glycosyltransferase involved in cell wall biosynthesis